jgi:hypothetical protein
MVCYWESILKFEFRFGREDVIFRSFDPCYRDHKGVGSAM